MYTGFCASIAILNSIKGIVSTSIGVGRQIRSISYRDAPIRYGGNYEPASVTETTPSLRYQLQVPASRVLVRYDYNQ